MKKLGLLLVLLVATNCMAVVDYGNSVHWTGTGDWMTQANCQKPLVMVLTGVSLDGLLVIL